MLLTSFWNTTIAGGIYGLLSSSLIFFLTTLYNEKVQKKNLEKEMFRTFLESNPELMLILEKGSKDVYDYSEIRNATKKVHTMYLKEGEIRNLLDVLIKINLLEGDDYRREKKNIPQILVNLYTLIKTKRDDLL